MITGGSPLINLNSPTKPDRHNTVARTNISSDMKERGTWPAQWELREKQSGLSGGQFLNTAFNATWIRSDARTRKRKGLEELDLEFLNKPWGLLVSVCTGVARRVALRKVMAEVMLPMIEAWMDKSVKWQDLMSTGEGLLNELKKPTFRDWFHTLNSNTKRAPSRRCRRVWNIRHILDRGLCAGCWKRQCVATDNILRYRDITFEIGNST
jgi:hypothetical protein